MFYRALAILAVLLVALNVSGCRSSASGNYEEVLMPLQTGSVLHRRVETRAQAEKKSKKKKTEKKEKSRKPEAEPSATPAPEEESTPPPERFR